MVQNQAFIKTAHPKDLTTGGRTCCEVHQCTFNTESPWKKWSHKRQSRCFLLCGQLL